MSLQFSIIIPTYNRKIFLKETLDSVLAQTFENYEVIVVDDGSTDNTQAFIESNYKLERLSYYYKDNGERGAARNFGWDKAKGNYVLFFDSDDIMDPTHLEELYQAIVRENEPIALATKYNFKRFGNYHDHTELKPLSSGYYAIELVSQGNALACHFCVKNELKSTIQFEENREYAIMEDWMFLVTLLSQHQLYLIDKVTITMIDHDGRSMRSDNQLIIDRRLLALQWIKKNVSLSEDLLQEITYYSYYFCAVHYRIDGRYKKAKEYIKMAVQLNGWNKNTCKIYIRSLFRC